MRVDSAIAASRSGVSPARISSVAPATYVSRAASKAIRWYSRPNRPKRGSRPRIRPPYGRGRRDDHPSPHGLPAWRPGRLRRRESSPVKAENIGWADNRPASNRIARPAKKSYAHRHETGFPGSRKTRAAPILPIPVGDDRRIEMSAVARDGDRQLVEAQASAQLEAVERRSGVVDLAGDLGLL